MRSGLKTIIDRYATIRIPLLQRIESSLTGKNGRNWNGEYNPWLAASFAKTLLAKELAEGKHPRLAGLLASQAVDGDWSDEYRFLVPGACPLGGPTVDEK